MKLADIKTLAEFKRFLAIPGATVQIMQHDSLLPIDENDQKAIEKRKTFLAPRTVAKVQTNAVRFINGSWLYFTKASHYRFSGNGQVTIDLNEDGKFSRVMSYRCTLPD